MIYIRTDGNRDIALGHVQRCLSIADAIRDLGEDVAFITAGVECRQIIEGRGYGCRVLGTDYRDMASELPGLERLLTEVESDAGGRPVVLLDSYQADETYAGRLKELGYIAYIDDMGYTLPVDILINYDIHAEDIPYERMYGERNIPLPGTVLRGCDYAPLRREFGDVMNRGGHGACLKQDRGINLLFTTGGGDMLRVAEQFVKNPGMRGLAQEMGLTCHIVAGPMMDEEEKGLLIDEAESRRDLIIHDNVQDMWRLMRDMDYAITSGGSTMYELCAMAVPAVCFTFAQNQRQMAESFAQKTGMAYLGDAEKDMEALMDCMVYEIKELILDGDKSRRLSHAMRKLVDGKGALRIARALVGADRI